MKVKGSQSLVTHRPVLSSKAFPTQEVRNDFTWSVQVKCPCLHETQEKGNSLRPFFLFNPVPSGSRSSHMLFLYLLRAGPGAENPTCCSKHLDFPTARGWQAVGPGVCLPKNASPHTSDTGFVFPGCLQESSEWKSVQQRATRQSLGTFLFTGLESW